MIYIHILLLVKSVSSVKKAIITPANIKIKRFVLLKMKVILYLLATLAEMLSIKIGL